MERLREPVTKSPSWTGVVDGRAGWRIPPDGAARPRRHNHVRALADHPARAATPPVTARADPKGGAAVHRQPTRTARPVSAAS